MEIDSTTTTITPTNSGDSPMSSTSSSSSSSSSASRNRELFVVQRCWHSGPHQYQPMDMMRLFTTQRDAEEAAYHSCHAWCRYQKPHTEPQVKTLLLPRYPVATTGNQPGTSYGFVAFGSLFWVRSITVTTNHSAATNRMMMMNPTFIPENLWEWNAQDAFCVVTEGVIGGTGNRMSRRGTEISVGRVFVAEPETHTVQMNIPVNYHAAREVMRRKAMETCHLIMAQLGNSVTNSIFTVPLGRPQEYSSGIFLKDWPPQVLQPTLVDDDNNHMMMGYQNKRSSAFSSSDYDHSFHHPVEDFGEEVECPFEPPPAAKRRRYCDDEFSSSPFLPPNNTHHHHHLLGTGTNNHHIGGEDTYMMSYAITGRQI